MTLPQPNNRPISDDEYELVEDYEYHYSTHGGSYFYKFIVPAGFVYDGASSPRSLWSLSGVRPDGLIRAPALVHDYLYEYRGKPPVGKWLYYNDNSGQWRPMAPQAELSRKDVDKIFGRMMSEVGMPNRQIKLAYWAVRKFGQSYWDN